MATFVIVHGMWSGGWIFQPIARILRDAGHEVYTPTLTGIGEREHLGTPETNLETHVRDVVSVLEFEDLREVILAGYSYGGVVATAVADRVPDGEEPQRRGGAGLFHRVAGGVSAGGAGRAALRYAPSRRGGSGRLHPD